MNSLLAELQLAPIHKPRKRIAGKPAKSERTALESLAPITSSPSTAWDADEQIIIRQLYFLDERLDYVLFRKFRGEQPPQVLAVVVDNEHKTQPIPQKDLAKIHKKLWLRGGVPIFYIGWPDKVDVISCADAPTFDDDGNARYVPLDIIISVHDELFRLHSSERLLDGTFWDDPIRNSRFAEGAKSAHQKLLEKILDFDRQIKGKDNPAARQLLLQTLLIKYLEDRGVFDPAWFTQFLKGADGFLALLKHGNAGIIKHFILKLEEKFNGGIFCIGNAFVNDSCIKALSQLVNNKVEANGQLSFWELYSFEHIPVEVISQIYERFSGPNTGSVYTPPALVDLILHHVMPYSRLRKLDITKTKIMDPTCGSGVFLVSALQRLFKTWQMQNKWEQPDTNTLKRILRNCIYGVDIQSDSVHITAFSLALALCDALPPPVIWRKLRFDDLTDKNLLIGDFMQMTSEDDPRLPRKVDFIVGNPPFLTRKEQERTAVERAAPDKNIAYAVLKQTSKHLTENGRLALVQPLGIIYSTNAEPFMREIFRHIQLDAIMDFASIRGMFQSADAKVVALIGTAKQPSSSHKITHYTFRRTLSTNERNVFELDYYDEHIVCQEELNEKNNHWIWRINLLGGGRLKSLARRLSSFPTLLDYVNAKKWSMGEGYIAGNSGEKKIKNWLTGKPLLPTQGLTVNGIKFGTIVKVTDRAFVAPRTENRYRPPMMLIREHETLPSAFWDKGFLAYKDKIVGINAPRKDVAEFAHVAKTFAANRDAMRVGCQLFGKQSLLGKATAVLKKDIDQIPWPEDGNWDMSLWEKTLADDLLNYIGEYIRKGQDSKLLKGKASKIEMEDYTSCFTDILCKLYPELNSGEAFF